MNFLTFLRAAFGFQGSSEFFWLARVPSWRPWLLWHVKGGGGTMSSVQLPGARKINRAAKEAAKRRAVPWQPSNYYNYWPLKSGVLACVDELSLDSFFVLHGYKSLDSAVQLDCAVPLCPCE